MKQWLSLWPLRAPLAQLTPFPLSQSHSWAQFHSLKLYWPSSIKDSLTPEEKSTSSIDFALLPGPCSPLCLALHPRRPTPTDCSTQQPWSLASCQVGLVNGRHRHGIGGQRNIHAWGWLPVTALTAHLSLQGVIVSGLRDDANGTGGKELCRNGTAVAQSPNTTSSQWVPPCRLYHV